MRFVSPLKIPSQWRRFHCYGFFSLGGGLTARCTPNSGGTNAIPQQVWWGRTVVPPPIGDHITYAENVLASTPNFDIKKPFNMTPPLASEGTPLRSMVLPSINRQAFIRRFISSFPQQECHILGWPSSPLAAGGRWID